MVLRLPVSGTWNHLHMCAKIMSPRGGGSGRARIPWPRFLGLSARWVLGLCEPWGQGIQQGLGCLAGSLGPPASEKGEAVEADLMQMENMAAH